MVSSPTTRNRILKQGTGDNTNTWGDQQSSGDFDMLDVSLDGVLALNVLGATVLSTANYVDDQARRRVLKFTAASTTAATITIPAVEKWYLVWNASAYDQIIACSGGGTSVTIKAGEMVSVACDAVNVRRLTLLSMQGAELKDLLDPTANQSAATKLYVDTAVASTVYTVGAFGVAIAPGDSGKFLTNNGSIPSWAFMTVSRITDYAADQATRSALAIAFAAAL